MAAFRSMSPRFPDGSVIQQWFKERNPQLADRPVRAYQRQDRRLGGAAPVFKGEEMVGAYGVSGGTSQQDEEMAIYARAKVGWAHESTAEPKASVKEHINALYAEAGITDRKL